MDEFCGSTFWVSSCHYHMISFDFLIFVKLLNLKDSNLTWHSDNPDLTPCFQQTVLVWVPCAFLWIFTLLEIYYIKHSGDKNIPKNFLNQSKLTLTAFLAILSISDLVYAINYDEGASYPLHFYSPVIKIASFVSIV